MSPADTAARAAVAWLLLLAGGPPRGAEKQPAPKVGGGCELEKSTGSVCSRPVSGAGWQLAAPPSWSPPSRRLSVWQLTAVEGVGWV